MRFWWAFLLLAIVGCAIGQTSSVKNKEDVSIRCQRIKDPDAIFNIVCNLTDHRHPDSLCSPKSVILPRFKKISIKCYLDSKLFIRTSSCKIVDLVEYKQTTTEKSILQANLSLSLKNLHHDDFYYDGFTKFESIFSNAFSVGQALVRCHIADSDKFDCSLFGIGDKASTTGNFSCTGLESRYGPAIHQCCFSEDHIFGRFKGNVTLVLNKFDNDKKLVADLLFVSFSSSPSLNIHETLRLECHGLRPLLNDGDLETSECGAYLNQDKHYEDPLWCNAHNNDQIKDEQIPTRDRLWELDRTVVINIDQVNFGKAQFHCNIADDFSATFAKCSRQFSDGSFFLDEKFIFHLSLNPDSIDINNAELILMNVFDKFYFHGIFIESCQIKLTSNSSKMTCDIGFGRLLEHNVSMHLQCSTRDTETTNLTKRYYTDCDINLLHNYTMTGLFVESRDDSGKIEISFNGSIKSVSTPTMSEKFEYSCSIDNSVSDLMKIDCKFDIGNIDQICKLFKDLCTGM